MILIRETTRTLPFYRPEPLTDLPLICHSGHLFPYTSYGDTGTMAELREFRMVTLENDMLRVEVAPELGGRVYSLFDKRIGKEILFSNPVVKPVRIPPIWGFISGGIAFNFPIVHSPTAIAEVGCSTGTVGDYGFIRVGEREPRTGMEWVVEIGLMVGCPALIQRSAFRNLTGADHPWMSWTICAMRSTEGTEFVHPPQRVLVHDERVIQADWPGQGLNWDRNAKQMTAWSWQPGGAPHFAVFHHDLDCGLMHLADPSQVPGKKIWTFGHGKHRVWAQDTTDGDLAYCEIESSAQPAQGDKPVLSNGSELRFDEFWIPVHSREACDSVEWPQVILPPLTDPWLGWKHSAWQTDWENFRAGDGVLPDSPVPTGIDLEASLRRELDHGNLKAAEPLALWLASHGQVDAALAVTRRTPGPGLSRIAGLLLWRELQQPMAAVSYLEAGPLQDPVAVAELDELYADLGLTEKRVPLLADSPPHRLIIERRADLAVASGQPAEAIRLLSETLWPRELQRYVRTNLWRRAMADLGESHSPVPDALHEDQLAPGVSDPWDEE